MAKTIAAEKVPAVPPDPAWPWPAPIRTYAIERRGGETRLVALTIDDGIVARIETVAEGLLPILLGQLETSALDNEIQGPEGKRW